MSGRPLQSHKHRQVREQGMRDLRQLRGESASQHRVQQHARRHVQGVPGKQLVLRREDGARALPLQRRLRAAGPAMRGLCCREGSASEQQQQHRVRDVWCWNVYVCVCQHHLWSVFWRVCGQLSGGNIRFFKGCTRTTLERLRSSDRISNKYYVFVVFGMWRVDGSVEQ